MILHLPRCKLTCPMKIDGCKMKFPFQNGPFLGDMLIFQGIYIYISKYKYHIVKYTQIINHKYGHKYTAFKQTHVKHLQAVMQTTEAFLLIDMQSLLATKKCNN